MLRWLRKLFDTVPPEDMEGILLDPSLPHWEISCPKKGLLPEFLEALSNLLPDDSVLYLEGASPSKDDEDLLTSMSVPERVHVSMDINWPRPRIFHIPATGENLRELARLAQHRALPEIAIHIHAYRGEQILLQWHDAFDNPIEIAREIPEQRVEEFCRKLGVRYRLAEGVGTSPNGSNRTGCRHLRDR